MKYYALILMCLCTNLHFSQASKLLNSNIVETPNEIQNNQALIIFLILLVVIIFIYTGYKILQHTTRLKCLEKEREKLICSEKLLKSNIDVLNKNLTQFAIEIDLNRASYSESIKNLNLLLKCNSGNFEEGIQNIIAEMKQKEIASLQVRETFIEPEKTSLEFKNHLLCKYPELTRSELELIVLIKLEYSNKEIASYRGVSPDSVKIMKNRLKRKLNLEANDNLGSYLMALNC